MKKIIIICFFLFAAGTCFAQPVIFQKTFGETNTDFGASVKQTYDGKYIICGSSLNAGLYKSFLLKTEADGDTIWTKSFDGPVDDWAFAVEQTYDGGFITTGYTTSFGAGQEDIFINRTDDSGNLLWSETIGGTNTDIAWSIEETNDHGFILGGTTKSFGSGSNDVYLLKIDSTGTVQWARTYGGSNFDEARSVQQTADGGYILAGSTSSFGMGVFAVYLIKTNAAGDTLWTRAYGGGIEDAAYAVQQTDDLGYIITGYTQSFGAGYRDVYLIKTDSTGNVQWSKAYGGLNGETGFSVHTASGGGYVIAGSTVNFGAGGFDAYLIKTDDNGNVVWTKTFGGIGDDEAATVQLTNDAGYIICGSTQFGAGFSGDIYLIKTDSLGNSGCNDGSTATIVTNAATQTWNTATSVLMVNYIVNAPATIAGNGCIVTTLCTTVGISPTPALPEGEGVAIAPNPSQGNFVITFFQIINKGAIEIYNVLGKNIFSERFTNASQKEIRLNNISAGIYFVKVHDGENEYSQKLVVQ